MENRAYDVFLSFSVKDRAELVYPLLIQLQNQGLRVWYSSEELEIGASLQQTILSGLEKSEFGLFLITPNSIDSPWPVNELNAMWGISNNGGSAILPVRHNVSHEEAAMKHPGLADRWSLSTDKGLSFIAGQVAKKIRRHKYRLRLQKIRNATLFLIALAVVSILGYREYNQQILFTAYSTTNNHNLRLILDKKIDDYIDRQEANYKARIEHAAARAVVSDSAIDLSDRFDQLNARYRNTYEYISPARHFQHKVHVEPAAGINFDTVSTYNNFGFHNPLINIADKSNSRNKFRHTLYYYNTQPLTYQIANQERRQDTIIVHVRYQNYIRHISINLNYGKSTSYYKKTHYQLIGMPPFEKIRMVQMNDRWILMKP